MIQMGEDLSLAKEVAQQFRSVHATLDHLNGPRVCGTGRHREWPDRQCPCLRDRSP
jgi:hypothetical protein